MPRIKFTDKFSYKFVRQQTFVYGPGDIDLVKQEVADKAIKEGKAVLCTLPAPPAGINNTLKKYSRKKKKSTEEILNEFSEKEITMED